MNNLIFKPLPSEDLYSWLLRLYRLSGYRNLKTYLKALDIEGTLLEADKVFTPALGFLIKQQLNPRQAVKNNTNLCIWQFSVSEIFDLDEIDLCKFTHRPERTVLRYDSSWHSCPMCITEDTEKYGTSYWHAPHQCPSIFQCYKHACILNRAKKPVLSLIEEKLPHEIDKWEPVILNITQQIEEWQSFVLKMVDIAQKHPDALIQIKERLQNFLGECSGQSNEHKVRCEEANDQFENALGPHLLKYLFQGYLRPYERGKTNIIRSSLSDFYSKRGERNPIYWIAFAYSQREFLCL